jgi:three-Cys-motif partner protein
MPPKKHPTVWEADPHTIAKIEILRGYLDAWFQILGRSRRGQDLLYVDGFAGPGVYTNHPAGSPLVALRAASAARAAAGSLWVAGEIHCAFIEADRLRFQRLSEAVKAYQTVPGVRTHLLRATFVEGLARLRGELPLAFTGAPPLLVFIDPFGATGALFATVAEILRSSCSEVLINLDADGIVRILHAGPDANRDALLDEIFGDPGWRTALSLGQPLPVLCDEVLRLYKQRLRSLPKLRYVFSFGMGSRGAPVNYFLVFASQHALGLEKMKESMRRIDQTGDYYFTDAVALTGQRPLFRSDDPEVWSAGLRERFRGRRVGYRELLDYALNETPFVNPKSMLRDLDQRGLIRVDSSDPRRRRGTFREETLKTVEFLAETSHGHEE